MTIYGKGKHYLLIYFSINYDKTTSETETYFFTIPQWLRGFLIIFSPKFTWFLVNN